MKNIFKIISLSKPLHGLVILIGFLILVSSALQLAVPIISKSIIDEIALKIHTGSGDINKVIFLVIVAFAANLLGTIITTISNRLGDHFAGKLRRFLTERFYDKILALPQSYFDGQISGKIVNQLNRGISTIYLFLNGASNFMLPMFLQSFFTIIVLAFYNLPIAFFTFLLFPIYLFISYKSTVAWGKAEVEKNKIEDLTRGRINEVIYNIRLVKGFTNELVEFANVSKNLIQINKIYARQSTAFHKFDFARNFSLILILFAVNILVFYNTFLGILTIGEMVLIIMLFNQARVPLFAMSYILTQIQTAEQGSREYLELVSLKDYEHYKDRSKSKKLTNAVLEFKNVSFQYEGSGQVLDQVNFETRRHETIAVVGHSGAGKTTLVNLIMKLYSPTKGEIYLNGTAYKDISAKKVRDNIALVFQENELFSSTIRENVEYGKIGAKREEIIDALKLANAWEFIEKFPEGIESLVGERGVKLSGGQKQRIQIARAIIKDAPILILDEATSSLDAKSEKEVQDGLENLIKDRLVIVIAHRFSTIQNANRILVIDEGRIVEEGTPGELAKNKGIYAELLNYQVEGNKKLLEAFEIY